MKHVKAGNFLWPIGLYYISNSWRLMFRASESFQATSEEAKSSGDTTMSYIITYIQNNSQLMSVIVCYSNSYSWQIFEKADWHWLKRQQIKSIPLQPFLLGKLVQQVWKWSKYFAYVWLRQASCNWVLCLAAAKPRLGHSIYEYVPDEYWRKNFVPAD